MLALESASASCMCGREGARVAFAGTLALFSLSPLSSQPPKPRVLLLVLLSVCTGALALRATCQDCSREVCFCGGLSAPFPLLDVMGGGSEGGEVELLVGAGGALDSPCAASASPTSACAPSAAVTYWPKLTQRRTLRVGGGPSPRSWRWGEMDMALADWHSDWSAYAEPKPLSPISVEGAKGAAGTARASPFLLLPCLRFDRNGSSTSTEVVVEGGGTVVSLPPLAPVLPV
mmetsp:Transcript_20043/g.44573  ORF Transcript_20043/g.44573 Transcript_20043/m.44573 type:complete len:232 (-) Transcript_20043:628-1323(-)